MVVGKRTPSASSISGTNSTPDANDNASLYNEFMSNVIHINPKKSPGRAGRKFPQLGDAKTTRALNRIRERGARARDRVESGKMPPPSLTPAEEDFCQLIAAGYSIREAGRQSGIAELLGTEHVTPMTQRAAIAMRINELLEEKRNTMVDEGERLRRFIAARLEDEAESAAEGSTRMKALEQLGKLPHVKAFEEQVNVTVSDKSSPEAIKEEIKRKLIALQGGKS